MNSLTKELWMEVPERRGSFRFIAKSSDWCSRAACRRALRWSRRCTSPPRYLSTITSRGCTTITRSGSKVSAPFHPSPTRYRHNRTGEDNADAHLKRQIMGREVVVAITEGKLHLGPWEHIFYYEFDGRAGSGCSSRLLANDAPCAWLQNKWRGRGNVHSAKSASRRFTQRSDIPVIASGSAALT